MNDILILSFWNPTPQSPNKGVFIHDQIKALCELRSDIIFLKVNILPSNFNLFKKGISIDKINSNTFISYNLYSFFWKFLYINPWLIYRLIKKFLSQDYPSFRPKLIHSNVIFPCGMLGYLLAKKFSAKHIISEHWSKSSAILSHPLYKSVACKAYKRSENVLCVSNFLANKIKLASGIKNITIIPNIINTEIFKYSPKQTNAEKVFTCVATWKKPKRLDLIIHSLVSFAEKTKQKVILNVVGSGIEKDEFKKTFRHNLLQINWIGNITKPDIAEVLYKSNFFLHASEIETFSIVTVEALSTGTPVLASNVGALPELIDSTNGLLVENTINSWIKGLHEITSSVFDNKLIANGVIGKYAPEMVAAKINAIYEETLKN